jgi:hypothetical protein
MGLAALYLELLRSRRVRSIQVCRDSALRPDGVRERLTKLAAVFVLRDRAGCNATRQIVRVGDRSAPAQCALTQKKNAQYERYSRRASGLSHKVKKFTRHRQNSHRVNPSPNVATSAACTFYGLPRLGRSCAERHSRRCYLPQSKRQARTRRKSVGVTPVCLRNAELKELVSAKPRLSPIRVTDNSGWLSSSLARSIRRSVR